MNVNGISYHRRILFHWKEEAATYLDESSSIMKHTCFQDVIMKCHPGLGEVDYQVCLEGLASSITTSTLTSI